MNAIVLAGGNDQIALLNELKHRGFYTVLVDYFQYPVAKPFADKHIQASTLDMDVVTQIAKAERADYVMAACTDQALLTAAYVSEFLHLPCHITYEQAMCVTNKRYMKQKFVENCIPTARYKFVRSESTEVPSEFRFPMVVKPVDCNSSKGVKLCHTEAELRDNLRGALSLSRIGSAVMEEYKSGVEISVDFFVKDGKVFFLCATESRKIKNVDSFTITQRWYPAITEEQEARVTAIGQRIAAAFGLRNSPMLVQLIMTPDDELFVLEFSARMGGGSKYKLIEVLTGIDSMKTFVDMALGKSPAITPKQQVNFAAMNYVYCYDGVFSGLGGFDDLLHFQYASVGTKVTKAETSGDRIAGFLLTANTREELVKSISAANSRIRVMDTRGNDIARHDLIGVSL